METLARCELALLRPATAADAVRGLAENETNLEATERLRARHLLWKATRDRAQLEEAKRLLDDSVAEVDDDTRHSMLTNLRVNRAIMAAWKGESDEQEDDDLRGTETMTRIGPIE